MNKESQLYKVFQNKLATRRWAEFKVHLQTLSTWLWKGILRSWPKAGKVLAILLIIGCAVVFPILVQNSLIYLKLYQKEITFQQEEKVQATKIKLEKDVSLLQRKLDAKIPKGNYLIINSASNEFTLFKGDQRIKKDKCSTGSYILLKNADEQEWMFKTPKGEFRIQGKTTSPVWKKPDWAFVEDGLPVPTINHESRFEYGVLGDYALSLGHGYLIHGTLYQRFLGLPVTHGCIRLGDENLELVYKSLSVGSKVYIF
ncbi:MAG: L,D-transpeptidase [Bacteroidales bacterium]|nr:L,D-transpeptidase [Bacteroidales bacterium]MCF8457389.1 L,D-transpeptidase [Bacteroidales bacterium]